MNAQWLFYIGLVISMIVAQRLGAARARPALVSIRIR